MKPVRLIACVVVLASFAAGAAHAVEFKSVGSAPAIMYDAPSEKGRRVFVAPRDMPVELVLSYGAWSKVRDASGDLSWIEAKALVPKRHVMTTTGAKVRASAEDAAPVVFTADKGVLLEFVELTAGWVKVRHRDGQGGFVKATEVWGE